ncbi:hypothetical protein OJ996_05770 [Luteolibacter sp. GHJ8]|uniref:Uncharacterized protein n=1 Tax=Luteolibacter rhizosphaerae TaxID=2989719 RepID=A0ABT3FZP9_9BACT|nr:hypothetical protein [Luteolibacter rhizosphaerae]MCW1913069.1 hypothetical protein [Luteolibacter rhizosphaerae]
MNENSSATAATVNTLRINAGNLPGFRPATTNPSRKNSSGTSRRRVWEDTIRTNAEAIMKHVGSVGLSASEMLDALTALGLKPFPIRKANGLGDAMGMVGLNLPVIEGYGRKIYLLLPLVMPAAEWAALASDEKALDLYVAEKTQELQAKPAVTDTTDTTEGRLDEAA